MMVVAVMVVTVSVVFGHNILQRYVTELRGLPTKNTQHYTHRVPLRYFAALAVIL